MDIKKYFKKNYPNLGTVRKTRLFNRNINSTNYIVITNKGSYVLRNFAEPDSSVKMEKVCEILNFCSRNKTNIVQPIKNKDNNYVNKKRYLTKYYEGRPYKGKISELKEAAKNLAILHSILARNPIKYNYRMSQNYFRHLNRTGLKRIKKIIISKKKKDRFDKKVLRNFEFLVKLFSEIAKTKKILRKLKLKKQLTHHDFHPQNVIFNKSKVAAILDFNLMRRAPKIEDIAFACFRFSSYKTNDTNRIKRRMKLFINSYLSYNDINKGEITYLDYYFIHEILNRLSFILKKRYFADESLWSADLEKHINSLKLAKKIGKFYEKT